MTFYTAADFDFMFETALGVGTATTYSLTSGTVNLIFRSSEFAADGFTPVVQDFTTSAKAKTSDIPNIAQGQTFNDGTTTFTVVGIGPDEEGVTELDLRVA